MKDQATHRRARPGPGRERPPRRTDDEERRQQLADVGHELKSPISVMLALCRRLEDSGRLERDDAEDVARIRANAYTMLRRVQDYMLMARLETAGVQLDTAIVDVAAIVRRCVEVFATIAELRGVRLVVEADGELPAVVDDGKLVSLVSNLTANAIRHAPAGGTVRCSLSATASQMRLEVADDGPGVPRAKRTQIFERYRGERNSASTGLGLAIVREIARLHGGSVTVGDAPEGGALFTVTMPLRPLRAVAPRSVRSLAIADRQRALVEELRADVAL